MKKALILRCGISGKSAAIYLANKGYQIIICDDKSNNELVNELTKDEQIQLLNKCEFTNFDHLTLDTIISVELVVVSPAIRLHEDIMKKIIERGIPFFSEIDLGLRENKFNRLIAVTGTNGKTTVATCINSILKVINLNSEMFGNMGIAFASNVLSSTKPDIIVLEVSAQQLEISRFIKPYIAIITNIKEDHINHTNNGDFNCLNDYIHSKYRIQTLQDENDNIVINYNDNNCQIVSQISKAKVWFFSTTKSNFDNGFYIDNRTIFRVINGNTIEHGIIPDNIRHDYFETFLIIIVVLTILDIKLDFSKIVSFFENINLPNRLEHIGNINGVEYINDSKATNPYSVSYALESYPGCILIVGSNNSKKSSFCEMATSINKNAKYCVLFDETKYIIANELEKIGYDSYIIVNNLKNAIIIANKISCKGDIIIFSPGGNSKPTFNNHLHRGECFCKYVRELQHESID